MLRRMLISNIHETRLFRTDLQCLADFKSPKKGQKSAKSKKGKSKQEEEERRQREEGHPYLSFLKPGVKRMVKGLF